MKKMSLSYIMTKIFHARGEANDSLIYLKKYYSNKEFGRCIKMMYSSRIYSKYLSQFYSVTNVQDLLLESAFPVLIMNQEYDQNIMFQDMKFQSSVFEANKERIIKFLSLKNSFENLYLNGMYEKAGSVLEEIYGLCGLSFWYIQSKLMLLNETDYKEYKEFYLNMRDSCENPYLKNYIRLIKRKVNMRTRQRTYYEFYCSNFEKTAFPETFSEMYACYIEFMSFQSPLMLNEQQKRCLVMMTYNLTLVDSFLLQKKILLYLRVHSPADEEIRDMFLNFEQLFYKQDEERGETYLELKKLFCTQQYESCKCICQEKLHENGGYFEILDLYIKCHLALNEELESGATPLLKLGRVLYLCYIKNEYSDYASGYIDVSDRYLRCLNEFSSYYELLSIIQETMYSSNEEQPGYYEMKLLERKFPNQETDLLIRKKFGYSIEDYADTEMYFCDWNKWSRYFVSSVTNVRKDAISKKMNEIDQNHIEIAPWSSDMTNLDRIFYEQYVVNKFQRFIEKKDYLNAIHVYMEVYFHSMYMVLKMNVKFLNEKLTNRVCSRMLDEIDFFLYMNIMEMSSDLKGCRNQTIVDSFRSILQKYKIHKPSELRSISEIQQERLMKYWEFCCNDILQESPCDLYYEEKYEEEIFLLDQLFEYTGQERYIQWKNKIEVELDYSKITGLLKKKDWITDKIVADWIYLENDTNVMSYFDDLKGFTPESLIENIHAFGAFKGIFCGCKKEYVKQVNMQMGTTIRHGILEGQFVQKLKQFDLFIPSCDEKEKKKICMTNCNICNSPEEKREILWNILRENCLKIFDDIKNNKQSYIFFTHEEQEEYYTPIYISEEEMRSFAPVLGQIVNENQLIAGIKKILDKILENQLLVMKKRVIESLYTALESYLRTMKKQLAENEIEIDLSIFEEEMKEEIEKIGIWFHLIHNGNQEYSLDEYLEYQTKCYLDVKIVYSSNLGQKKLDIIRCVDIILSNMVRNMERHSGYADLGEADAKITLNGDNGAIEIIAENKVKSKKNQDHIKKAVSKINEMNKLIGRNETIIREESGEKHGLGYPGIAEVLSNYGQKPNFNAEFSEGVFRVMISFGCEGGAV